MEVEAQSDRRREDADADPQKIKLIDQEHRAVGQKIWNRAGQIRLIAAKAPPDMRMPEAAQEGGDPFAVQVRRMWIALAVGKLMMPAMGGAPADRHALRRHRAQQADEWSDNRNKHHDALQRRHSLARGNVRRFSGGFDSSPVSGWGKQIQGCESFR